MEVQAQIRDWQEVLGHLTPQEIANGWDKWDSEFPPNALQFRTACKTEIQQEAHKPYTALPKPKVDENIALTAIAEMHAMTQGAEKIDHVGPEIDISRAWYMKHGYINPDGAYDRWLMTKPHKDFEYPVKDYRG